MKQGKIVISLDFELIWGVFDHLDLTKHQNYFKNTLEIIPKLITVLERNEIKVTWATVGMLFNENWKEWKENIPNVCPTYTNTNLNPYIFGEKVRNSINNDFVFAPRLIEQLKKSNFQEVATHTYGHYYCLEKGQTKLQFESDLESAMKLGKKFDCVLRSLVFPRNQYNESYIDSCAQYGITAIRSNPKQWYWNTKTKEHLLKKIFRSGDAYLPLGKKTFLNAKNEIKSLSSIQASRLLRPLSNNVRLNNLMKHRIKSEILQAAKDGEIYHLWWHPHNFGERPKESMEFLSEIIDHFNYCRKHFGMESVSMNDLTKESIC